MASQKSEIKHYRFAVVGNGLMGSAAGRYLAEWTSKEHPMNGKHHGDSVVIIGAPEPKAATKKKEQDSDTVTTKAAVFSSHYDQGRLCSPRSPDPVWNILNERAVSNYAELEAKSGIQFHGPVGRVYAKRRSAEEEGAYETWFQKEIKKQEEQQSFNASQQKLQYAKARDHASWQQLQQSVCPMLHLPQDCDLFYQPSPAGYINPRQLIRAQNIVAQQHGATILEEVVVRVYRDESLDKIALKMQNDTLITADQVIVACGAFTNFHNLLDPTHQLPLKYKTESMVWGTVSETTAFQLLKNMPTVGYDVEVSNDDLDDPYVAPPLRYPDGTYKIKLGCNTRHEQWPKSLQEIHDWFEHGNSDADLPAMANALQTLLPGVVFDQMTSHRCIVTYTPSGYPIVDKVAPGIVVATGGNGQGACGSDTLGQLAARLAHDGTWDLPTSIPRHLFQANQAWGDSSNGQQRSKAQQRAQAQAEQRLEGENNVARVP